jgi:hypothetical protein
LAFFVKLWIFAEGYGRVIAIARRGRVRIAFVSSGVKSRVGEDPVLAFEILAE